MNHDWRTSVWQQFGAAIDMLDDVISLCPDQLWTAVLWTDPDDVRYGQFWFLAYHTVMWLDLHLTGSAEGFAPPPPFIRGALPDHPYTQAQIRAYLAQCRSTCQSTIVALTDEQAAHRCVFEWMELSFLELLLYGMRHVQEHAAQLSLVLGQHEVPGMDWVAQARNTAA